MAFLLFAGQLTAPQAPPEEVRDSPPRVEVPELAVPDQPPPPVSAADRVPVPADVQDNTIRHPLQAEPAKPPLDLAEQAEGPVHRPELGGPNYDVFAELHGGTHAGVVYPEEVNVETSDGDWVKPGSLLTASAEGWTAHLRDIDLTFPREVGSGSPVLVDLPEHRVASSLKGADRAEGRQDGETLIYEGVLPSVDRVLWPVPHGYKENLILRGSDAPASFSYEIDAGSLSLRPAGNGQLVFLSGGEPVAFVPTPVAYDASPDLTDSLPKATLTDLGEGRYRLDLALDEGFLAEATFP
ncbi:MAG: hypothetical protein ACRDHV_04805 [Actinomycetota bacterium]